jgi:acetyltransferase-like isoleucine patch superfamily enzyme
VTRLGRVLAGLWPWRWTRSVVALTRGIRVHPSAVLLGRSRQLRLARGTVVGARTRVLLYETGRLVTNGAVWISSDVEIVTDSEVSLGAGTTVQSRCTLNGATRVGRDCIFAPNVFVSSGTHPFRLQPHLPIREQERRLGLRGDGMAALDRPVWIQDDCWLGANVVVCPGVTVGKGAIVGANSVVVHDVTPYSVVAGAPARQIGGRLSWNPPREIHADRETDLVYVLSGATLHQAGAIRAVAARAGEPLRFALAPGAKTVRIRYQASHGVSVRVADRIQSVERGEGVLELPADLLPRAFGAALVEISLVEPAAAASLSVRDVESIGTGT